MALYLSRASALRTRVMPRMASAANAWVSAPQRTASYASWAKPSSMTKLSAPKGSKSSFKSAFAFSAALSAGVATAAFAGSELMHAKEEETALNSGKFQAFTVEHIRQLNHNTKILTFAVPNGTGKVIMPIASCVVVKAGTDDDGKPVIRPYTPINDNGAEKLELLVKVYPDGKGSSYIDTLKEGDTLEFKGPFPKLPYEPNMKSDIGMLAGGTGITPMLQVIRRILDNPEDKTRISLVFGNVTEHDILLRKDLDEMAAKHPSQFKVFYVIDKPDSEWQGGSGHVNADVIREHLPAPGSDSLALICGPPGFVKALAGPKKSKTDQGELKGALKDVGFSEENVYKF